MPIRGFDQLICQGSVLKLPISIIHDTAVAIDGFWYIKKYYPGYSIEDILDFTEHLGDLLKPLCELSTRTQILWIWDGLDYRKCKSSRDEPSFRAKDASKKLRMNGIARNVFDMEMYVQPVTARLRSAGITVIRAPYAAMAQCAYLLNKNCVKYVFSKNDALLFEDCNKLLIDISFSTGTIEVLDRNNLICMNGMDLESLQCISFLSGCEVCPTIPIFANNFNISNVIRLVKSGNIVESLKEWHARQSSGTEFVGSDEYEYLKTFSHSFLLFIYHPVMNLNGEVRCLEMQGVPNDLDKLFGKPLPARLYKELFTCNITPSLLNEIAHDSAYEDPWKEEILDEFEERMKTAEENEKQGVAQSHNDDPVLFKKAVGRIGINIALSEEFDPMIQAMFIKLQSYGFDTAHLLRMLNSGNVNLRASAAVNKIEPDDLLFYLRACEYFMILGDLIHFVGILNNDERLWAGKRECLCYKDFICEWQKDPMKKFLEANAGKNRGLSSFIPVLNKCQ